MPNKELNSLPHAAKPEATYGTKKITIMTAEIAVMTFFSSWNLLAKKVGTVIAPILSE